MDDYRVARSFLDLQLESIRKGFVRRSTGQGLDALAQYSLGQAVGLVSMAAAAGVITEAEYESYIAAIFEWGIEGEQEHE